ncbi:MAG: nucleoside monophosphate kinase [Paracoccaceae bacterium]
MIPIPTQDAAIDNLVRIYLDSQLVGETIYQIENHATQTPLALIVYDVDKSKRLRAYSVEFKIKALQALAAHIRQAVGSGALALAQGTRDEIIVALPLDPDATPQAALDHANRIRTSVADDFTLHAPDGKHLAVTITGGVAIWHPDHGGCGHTLLRADCASFLAKRHGGNACDLAGDNDMVDVTIPVSGPLPDTDHDALVQTAVDLVCQRHAGLETFARGVDMLGDRLALFDQQPFCVLLAGPPGAGKSALAREIRDRTGARSLAVRLRLGALTRANHPLAARITKAREAEGLVQIPDTLVGEMISEFLDTAAADISIILEGLPINAAQAGELKTRMAAAGRKIDLCIFVTAPKRTLQHRVATRKVCTACETATGGGVPAALNATRCPTCGGPLSTRTDGSPEHFEMRYANFLRDQTLIKDQFADVHTLDLDTALHSAEHLADQVLATLLPGTLK